MFFFEFSQCAPEEVLLSVFIPYTTRFEFVDCFKQCRRRDDDVTICGAAFHVTMGPSSDGWRAVDPVLAFAGMKAWTVRATCTEEKLKVRSI